MGRLAQREFGIQAARTGRRASLAVTGVDPEARKAWSVIVKGTLGPGEAGVDGAGLFTWAHAGKDERVRLAIDEVSGRRLAERKPD